MYRCQRNATYGPGLQKVYVGNQRPRAADVCGSPCQCGKIKLLCQAQDWFECNARGLTVHTLTHHGDVIPTVTFSSQNMPSQAYAPASALSIYVGTTRHATKRS